MEKRLVSMSNGVETMCLENVKKMHICFPHKCIFFQNTSRLKVLHAKNIGQWTDQSLSGICWKIPEVSKPYWDNSEVKSQDHNMGSGHWPCRAEGTEATESAQGESRLGFNSKVRENEFKWVYIHLKKKENVNLETHYGCPSPSPCETGRKDGRRWPTWTT